MSHKFNPYKDSHHHKQHKQHKHNTLPDYNKSRSLGKPKYKVIYHVNNDSILNIDQFIIDNQVYAEGDIVTIKDYNIDHPSVDGLSMYSFVGWAYSPTASYAIEVNPLQELTVNSKDIVLYAQWESVPTVHVLNDGGIYIKEDFRSSLRHLSIPEYYRGKRITKIVAPGFSNTRITSILIPASIKQIESGAFDRWLGTSISFAEAEITEKYPGLILDSGVFSNTTNLTNILLPYRLLGFSSLVFPKENKAIDIYVRHRKEYMSVLTGIPLNVIDDVLADENDADVGYIRNIQWGYNE